MNNEDLQPHYVKNVILELIRSDQRTLAWELIDYYYKKATTLEHFDILGYVSLKADKRDTYLKCAEAAYSLALTPEQLFNARNNLYKAYNTMNRPEDALFYIEQNLLVNPDNFDAQCQKAFNISLMGDKETAEKMLVELTVKYPESAHKLEAAFSGKLLREGRTAEGILSYIESLKSENQLFEKTLRMSRWNGTITPGKTLYVYIEGGIGDQIINIRFFDRLTSYGMKPVLVSYNSDYFRDINSVFRSRGYDVLTDKLVIDNTQPWVPMMSLPGYMGLTESNLWSKPYIFSRQNEKNKLDSKRVKIGIKCSGNPFFQQDEYRKIPLDQIINILPENVDIYYIDKEKVNHPKVINLADRISSWEDTFDFIDQMDCIVSSCTSLVHAAGAMGKTTFVAVPIAEYYIWTTTKRDGTSPWYGKNFYVARQTRVRDWTAPLSDISEKVCEYIKNVKPIQSS
jgi:tetratricopeptide (TPR) repeat protein